MKAFRLLCVRFAAWSVAVVLALGLTFGIIRLLPWILSQEVGIVATLPFARALSSAALEAALLLGSPAGVAIGASLFVERGEHRALAALGMTPLRVLSSLSLPAVVVIALAIAAAGDPAGKAPGRLARHLVEKAREGCSADSPRAQSDVPLLRFGWVCTRPLPRLAGGVPGVPGTWFSASTIEIDDDLRAVHLSDLSVVGRRFQRSIALHVRRSTITGLPGWGTPRHLSGVTRGLVVGFSAVLLSALVAWRILLGEASTLTGSAAALASAVLSLAVLRALDARAHPGPIFLLVPALGALSVLAISSGFSAIHRRLVARNRPR